MSSNKRIQYNIELKDTKLFEQEEKLKEVFGQLPRHILLRRCFGIVLQLSEYADDGKVTLLAKNGSGERKEVIFVLD